MGMLMTLLANPPVPRTLWSLRTFGSLDSPASPPLSPPRTEDTIILPHFSQQVKFPAFFLESFPPFLSCFPLLFLSFPPLLSKFSPLFYRVFRLYSRFPAFFLLCFQPFFYHVSRLYSFLYIMFPAFIRRFPASYTSYNNFSMRQSCI